VHVINFIKGKDKRRNIRQNVHFIRGGDLINKLIINKSKRTPPLILHQTCFKFTFI
jgi:hypothetical protein